MLLNPDFFEDGHTGFCYIRLFGLAWDSKYWDSSNLKKWKDSIAADAVAADAAAAVAAAVAAAAADAAVADAAAYATAEKNFITAHNILTKLPDVFELRMFNSIDFSRVAECISIDEKPF